jgi:hypothetical protein
VAVSNSRDRPLVDSFIYSARTAPESSDEGKKADTLFVINLSFFILSENNTVPGKEEKKTENKKVKEGRRKKGSRCIQGRK